MTLVLYRHPLSSFCHKVLIALYENATPFEARFVDLFDEVSAAPLKKLWPVGKMPVLYDAAKDRTVAESSCIIEYLDHHYPGPVKFVPDDRDRADEVQFRDRFFDLYVHMPMQKIVTDRLRPAGKGDPSGVEGAQGQLATALDMLERDMTERMWAAGDAFTMADCAAAPPLFYANMIQPFGATHPNVAAYLGRLMQRPSFARCLAEAAPYFDAIPR